MILLELFGLFFALALVGVPLVYALLATTAGFIVLKGLGHPPEAILLAYVGGVEPFILLAVPLFIVAGELLSQGGVGRRIIVFARTLFGFLPGGLGVVTVAACLLFGGVSGSAVAGAAAVGSVMIPAMVDRGYPKAFAAALVAAAGTLAIIIPPSIPMLVYGFVANASVRDLFVSGIVPGVLFGLSMIAICVHHGRRYGWDRGGARATRREILAAFRDALPALAMPLIILGGIWFGLFTPTESAAVAVAYGLVVSMLVYRDLRWRDLPGLVLNAFVTSAVVMVVIGATTALAWLITVEQVPAQLTAMVRELASARWSFLLLVNAVLLVLGIFLEPLPALILTAPVLVPIAAAFGVDPVHLGLLMTCNLAIGLYSPPVGGTLFVAGRIAGVGIAAISRALVPLFVSSLVVLALVTYVEWLPMGLVRLLRG